VSILVITLLLSFATATALSRAKSSGAAGAPTPSAYSERRSVELRVPAPDCPSAHKAVRFYRARYVEWVRLRGAVAAPRRMQHPSSCPRYLAALWQRKARAARLRYERWHAYHYDWRSWLPDLWLRIGACETGYGRPPGDWKWNSGTYEGAFGFHYSTWDHYHPRATRKARPYPDAAYEATPRQQYEVALAVYRSVGIHAWGCA